MAKRTEHGRVAPRLSAGTELSGKLTPVESLRETTARGSGHWGHHAYGVELATRATTWTDSGGTRARTLLKYELLIPVRGVGARYFSTDEERRPFLGQSFSDLTVHALDSPQRETVAHPLASLIGQRLDTVELLSGYAQLCWGSNRLNVYARAHVKDTGGRTEHSTPEYPHRLCWLAGQKLAGVDELLDRGLVLTFADNTELVRQPPLGS